MNLIRYIGKKKLLGALAGALLFLFAMQRAFTPQSIFITCDPRWTEEVQQAVKKNLEQRSIRTTGATRLKAALQTEFPCTKDIVITYGSPQRARVQVLGWLPRVRIISPVPGTQEYVLCEKGTILQKQFFTPHALDGVPALIIEGQDFDTQRTAKEFIETVLQLTNKLFNTYTIVWHSKTNICLHDHAKKIVIISDMHSIHDLARFDYVERIYAHEEKYAHGMKADIRLKDSLVCAPITNYNKVYEKPKFV